MGIHEKGNVNKRDIPKKRKKLKKVVDIEDIIWYINGATCKKKQVSNDL